MRRPDMLSKAELSKKDIEYLRQFKQRMKAEKADDDKKTV